MTITGTIDALKNIEYVLRKDSLTDNERVESARIGINRLLAKEIAGACGVAQAGWQPIKTRPTDTNATYLVANAKGQVAPWIRGVIHNNVGSAWDWDYGEAVCAWMPLPAYSVSSTPRATPDPERCLTCGRSDKEYATGDWYCNDPWHGDDHLRRSPRVTSTPRETEV